MVPEVEAPHKVTIVPRGRSLGTTMVLPEKESYHMQKKRMLGHLTLCFGGRVAEQEFCGDISAGAFDDIKRATDMARTMVSELGMSEKIGPINYVDRQGSDFLGTELMRGRMHSEETAREIDREVQSILEAAYKRAEEILRGRREVVETVAQALLAYETINGEDVQRLMKGATVESLRPGLPPPPATGGVGEARKASGASVASPKPSTGELPGTAGLSPA